MLQTGRKTKEFPDIYGFFANPLVKQKEPKKLWEWWRCAGTEWYQERINENLMEVFEVPIENHYAVYYAKSCTQALKYYFPNLKSYIISAKRVEIWKDFATGVHGFVDFIATNRQNNSFIEITMEFDDNRVEELKIQVNDFQAAKKSKVVIVVTAYNRTEQFQRFLNSLDGLSKQNENFGVCIGLFEEDDSNPLNELARFQKTHSNMEIVILKTKLPFKKAPVLNECVNTLQENDIAFMVDVDVTFTDDILKQVRRYVVKGKRFYSPIIWFKKTNEKGDTFGKNVNNAFAYGGTGIIALYKSDIDSFGGYDDVNYQEEHGFEDTDFFFRAKYKKLQAARYLEDRMQHWPHLRNTWEKDNPTKVNFCQHPSSVNSNTPEL